MTSVSSCVSLKYDRTLPLLPPSDTPTPSPSPLDWTLVLCPRLCPASPGPHCRRRLSSPWSSVVVSGQSGFDFGPLTSRVEGEGEGRLIAGLRWLRTMEAGHPTTNKLVIKATTEKPISRQ